MAQHIKYDILREYYVKKNDSKINYILYVIDLYFICIQEFYEYTDLIFPKKMKGNKTWDEFLINKENYYETVFCFLTTECKNQVTVLELTCDILER